MYQGPAESGTPPVGGVQVFAKQTLPQGEFISPEDVKKSGFPTRRQPRWGYDTSHDGRGRTAVM